VPGRPRELELLDRKASSLVRLAELRERKRGVLAPA
jgi:hypothetical protein